MKESGKNFLLVIVSFFVVFAVLEISLRVYYGNQPVFLFPQVSHIPTAYGYKLTPNQTKSYTLDKLVVTNSYGFRDFEWEMPKPPGRIRIMCMGDSFTFGNATAFEAIYSKVLERMLKKQDPNIEVITTAAGGWATAEEADFLKLEGLGYEPNLVIIGLYALRPRHYSGVRFSEEGRVESRPWWLRWLPYRNIFILKRSAVITYLRLIYKTIGAENDIVNILMSNEVDMDKDPQVIDTFKCILEIKKTCRAKNIKVILASIPPANMFWVPRGQPRYNDRIRSFCQDHDILFVDLSEGFWRVKNPTGLYYYPWDLHINPQGHHLVAEQLYQPVMDLLQASK